MLLRRSTSLAFWTARKTVLEVKNHFEVSFRQCRSSLIDIPYLNRFGHHSAAESRRAHFYQGVGIFSFDHQECVKNWVKKFTPLDQHLKVEEGANEVKHSFVHPFEVRITLYRSSDDIKALTKIPVQFDLSNFRCRPGLFLFSSP